MWEAIKDVVFAIVQFFYNFVGDWGLAIIIVTIIFRAIMTPLVYKQSKSTYQMQKLTPLMNKVRETFADDPVRQNQELQKLYAETKFNPLAGCLPMLIQIPIFIALYQTLITMGDRTAGTEYTFYGIVPDLVMSPSVALTGGFGTFVPYLILLIIFATLTFLPMILSQSSMQSSQKNQMIVMAVVMGVFMLFIGWSSPAGVLLYWGTSSILALIQSRVSLRLVKKKDEEAEAERAAQPIDVTVTRKKQKKRQSKKR